MAEGYIYGGNTGISYAELKRRRAIAEALASRQRKYPSNLGEGLTYFAEQMREGWEDRKLAEAEKEQMARDAGAFGPTVAPVVPPSTPSGPPPAVAAAAAPGPIVAPATPDVNTMLNPAAGALPPGGIGARPPIDASPAAPAPAGGALPAPPPRAGLEDPVWARRSQALAGIETGGKANPYQAVTSYGRGNVYGKYQIKDTNIPEWTQAALGRALTPEEFLADPRAQELTARHRFSQYADQYGEEGAARSWFGGPPNPKTGQWNLGATDRFGRLNVASYGQDFMRRMGGPGEAAGAPPGSREAIAATVAQQRQGPPTPREAASEEILQETLGGRGGGGSLFPPTASAGRAGIATDAPTVGASPLTGAVTDQGIGDTLQSQRNAITRTISPPPQETYPPTAQVRARSVPVTGSDAPQGAIRGSVAPPPGLLPASPAVVPGARPVLDIPPAPQPLRAPDPGPEPRPPGPSEQMQRMRQVAGDANRYSPEVRQEAARRYEEEQRIQQADFQRHWTSWNQRMTAKQAADLAEPQTRQQLEAGHLGNIKTRRELEGEGAIPMTPQQRQQFGVQPNVAAWLRRDGTPAFGPAGTNVSVNTADSADAGRKKFHEKVAENWAETLNEGSVAADQLKTLSDLRQVASRVRTGPEAVAKAFLGKYGIKTEGIGDIEAFNATVNRLIPQQRVPGSGPTSDFDARTFRDSLPTLMTSTEGTGLIMNTMEGLVKNKMARAEIVSQWATGKMNMAEGIERMTALQAEARAMSDSIKAHVEARGVKLDEAGSQARPATAYSNDEAVQWLKDNPDHPYAASVRKKLGIQ